MSELEITAELLNAYVDGELSRMDAAGVARAAARSPSLAARIATLREMKAAVADMAPERKLSLPEREPASRWRPAFAAAAAIAICLFGGLVYALLPAGPARGGVSAILESHHQAWAFARAADDIAMIPAGLGGEGWPPDLSSAQLSFAGQESLTVSGAPVLRLGYEGTRGCKLSLYILARGLLPAGSEFQSSLHTADWTISGRGYVLMADGMPRKRFEDIAIALETSIREGAPFDASTRQRLARARRASPPCRA